MKYRREIDGLRAIAVVPVILFHAGFAIFSGGFVGVDIFFVISGYLITTILLNELDRGDLSIVRFYERRARRILPALFFVMAACLPFAWLWMMPGQWSDFGKSLVAVTAFCSNILFWMQTGYFDGSAELRPLLHTWSLAVEEQYYLLFPIALMLLWRLGRKWVFWLVVAAALASFGMSEYASHHAESANFYLSPPRAWELLAGSICAFVLQHRDARSNNGLSALGLVLIVGAIFMFDDNTSFPGVYALAPVVGTALIILYAGAGTHVARLLSMRGFVGIGLISYSAYLWHQPLFAFARLQSLTEPAEATMAVLAGVSLLLAWFSWRFVEQPFRKGAGSLMPERRQIFIASAVAGVVAVGIGLVIARQGLPSRIERDQPQLFANGRYFETHAKPVFQPCDGLPNSAIVTCQRFGSGPRQIVVWGDSHAAMFSNIAYATPDQSVYFITHWGCPPAIGVRRHDRFGNFFNCGQTDIAEGYARFIESLRPEKVFLIGRWTLYLEGNHQQSRLQRDTHFITDGREPFDGAASSRTVLTAALEQTVDRLKAHSRVYIVQQFPDMHRYSARGMAMLPAVPRAPIARWHANEARMLAALSRHGATVVWTHDLICDQAMCAVHKDGALLYRDDNHLGFSASRQFYDHLQTLF